MDWKVLAAAEIAERTQRRDLLAEILEILERQSLAQHPNPYVMINAISGESGQRGVRAHGD